MQFSDARHGNNAVTHLVLLLLLRQLRALSLSRLP